MFKKILTLVKNIFYNRFEEAVAISSTLIIVIAIAMDQIMFLQACPLCILTRYVFALLAISSFIGILIKKNIIGKLLITISSILGVFVTIRQIYIQNMSADQVAQLSGCSMPFHTQVDYFGVINAVTRTLAGGPSCAEDGWRFIFNFAEWGLLFFVIYLIASLFRLMKYYKN